MQSNDKRNPIRVPIDTLLSADGQSPVFYLINVEYFFIYHGVKANEAKRAIRKGLSNNLINANGDLKRKAAQWQEEHYIVLENLALELSLELKRQHKHLPIAAMKRLPPDIKTARQSLTKTPNDHLCHFHLGWLYLNAKNYALAERHFNVAALQSQAINPSFSCFAYRHLAHARFKNNKYSQALLATETACTLSQSYNPELQFERIRFLSRAQRTTQAMPHLAALISKAPHYEIFTFHDTSIQQNPSLQRFFKRAREKHTINIQRQLIERWKNDPLHLLNLDRELGHEDSIMILQQKQREILLKLSPLLIFNEALSINLIQKRSRSIIISSLNMRKQQYIYGIEGHQKLANKIHQTGQWMLYAAVVSLIALGLSYVLSTIADLLNFGLPINLYVQSLVVGCALGLALFGAVLLHFTPRKLSDLIRQKQRLDEISSRLGVST